MSDRNDFDNLATADDVFRLAAQRTGRTEIDSDSWREGLQLILETRSTPRQSSPRSAVNESSTTPPTRWGGACRCTGTHPVPRQRAGIDDRRQPAGPTEGRHRTHRPRNPLLRSATGASAIRAFATPSAAAAAFSESRAVAGTIATATESGTAMISVLKICPGSMPAPSVSALTASAPNDCSRRSKVRTSCGTTAFTSAAMPGVAALAGFFRWSWPLRPAPPRLRTRRVRGPNTRAG